MSERAEHVVVLGAGAVGVATAWYLLEHGFRVTVIDRQPAAALETSWGNGGVIHASEVEPWSQPGMPRKILGWLGKEDAPLLVRYGVLPRIWRWALDYVANCRPDRFSTNTLANLELALHSLRSLQEIAARTGIDYDRATRGVLKIYRDPAALDAAARGAGALAPHGLLFERLDAAGCAAREPALDDTRPTLAGGLFFERDEVGDCNKFTQGLAEACAARGAAFRYGTTVEEIVVRQAKVAAIRTDRGAIETDRAVAALGSFTAPLLHTVGVRAPIRPVKGVSITFARGGWTTAPRVPVIDDSKLFGLVPIGDRIRISGSAEVADYDATPSPARGAAIAANAAFTFPELKRHYRPEEARLWAGLRPVTPSGRPLIGRTPVDGLWINAGHGHLGWTMACGSGRALADLMAGQEPGVPLQTVPGVEAPAA